MTTTEPTTELTGAALAAEILTKVLAHPEQFDMTHWAAKHPKCGTTMCVAGWAVALNGGVPDFRPDDYISAYATMPGGRRVHIANEAASLLGLDEDGDDPFGLDDDSAIDWLREYATDGEVPAW